MEYISVVSAAVTPRRIHYTSGCARWRTGVQRWCPRIRSACCKLINRSDLCFHRCTLYIYIYRRGCSELVVRQSECLDTRMCAECGVVQSDRESQRLMRTPRVVYVREWMAVANRKICNGSQAIEKDLCIYISSMQQIMYILSTLWPSKSLDLQCQVKRSTSVIWMVVCLKNPIHSEYSEVIKNHRAINHISHIH